MTAEPDNEKAWLYVGRFMWAFAIIEAFVDEILVALFSLNAAASLMLLNKLNLQRKLNLVKLGLRHQGLDYGEVMEKVQKFATMRNVIAHSSFVAEVEGIDFDVVNQSGKLILPNRPTSARQQSEILHDTLITYSQFDSYDSDARELFDVLARIGGSCQPIGAVEDDLASAIAQEVGAFDNIIPFPRRPQTDD